MINRTTLVRIVLYSAVIILLNLVSMNLFFRIDLTENNIYSLSDASKSAVSSLKEPLTIKAFFSANLPQPYNNLQQEMRDLLDEYSLRADRHFNYSIDIIGSEDGSEDEKSAEAKAAAESYGIYPIQIQKIEQDEVQLVTAYMGFVILHADMSETIAAISPSENLEFRITSTINTMSRKISALLALEEDVNIRLYLSSSLYAMGEGVETYPSRLESVVSRLNSENYNKLSFIHIDPDNQNGISPNAYNLTPLYLQTDQGDIEVYASVVIEHENNYSSVDVLYRGLFGYQMQSPEELEPVIGEIVEKVIGTNQKIGFLASHGAPSLAEQDPNTQQQAPAISLTSFNSLASENYAIEPIDLKNSGIPEGLNTLFIVSPKESFTDRELYEIDQFIMKGNSVAFFLDKFDEYSTQGSNPYAQTPPVYMPRETGLDKLLEHYGIGIKASYVMDENCYVQVSQQRDGSIAEVPYYFAPQIPADYISTQIDFMNNIKGLIMLNISPLIIPETDTAVKPLILFSSSNKSWEVSEEINLYNPLTIQVPFQEEEKYSQPLAAIIDGQLTSYFKDKPVPEKPPVQEQTADGEIIFTPADVSADQKIITETDSGKIFLIGTSMILADNTLDAQGTSPNGTFVLNLLDYLNGREDYAVMRSKGQTFNPLNETTGGIKSFIKGFNIIGLPILVILMGALVWIKLLGRKKKIKELFGEEV